MVNGGWLAIGWSLQASGISTREFATNRANMSSLNRRHNTSDLNKAHIKLTFISKIKRKQHINFNVSVFWFF